VEDNEDALAVDSNRRATTPSRPRRIGDGAEEIEAEEKEEKEDALALDLDKRPATPSRIAAAAFSGMEARENTAARTRARDDDALVAEEVVVVVAAAAAAASGWRNPRRPPVFHARAAARRDDALNWLNIYNTVPSDTVLYLLLANSAALL
jgi:hypothetical protein